MVLLAVVGVIGVVGIVLFVAFGVVVFVSERRSILLTYPIGWTLSELAMPPGTLVRLPWPLLGTSISPTLL